MSAPQNYWETSAILVPYDGNANSLEVTYHGLGLLNIYEGRMYEAPTRSNRHLTQTKSFDVIGDADTHYDGLDAYKLHEILPAMSALI